MGKLESHSLRFWYFGWNMAGFSIYTLSTDTCSFRTSSFRLFRGRLWIPVWIIARHVGAVRSRTSSNSSCKTAYKWCLLRSRMLRGYVEWLHSHSPWLRGVYDLVKGMHGSLTPLGESTTANRAIFDTGGQPILNSAHGDYRNDVTLIFYASTRYMVYFFSWKML